MKALTVKQPYASLIVEGIKDIENRTWRTKLRGRVYVHAAQKPSSSLVSSCLNVEQIEIVAATGKWSNHASDLPQSAIIGEVDIVDCVLNHSSVWTEQMKFDVCPDTGIHILRKGQPYVWNWVLANPVKYDQPIMNVKGALSFWNYERPNPSTI